MLTIDEYRRQARMIYQKVESVVALILVVVRLSLIYEQILELYEAYEAV